VNTRNHVNSPIRKSVVGIVLVGATWCAPVCCAQEKAAGEAQAVATPDAVAGWIKDLDDPRYLTREQASQNLLTAGEAALGPLLVVANSDRPEPADRAVWILRRLSKSRDSALSLGALERLVELQNRPTIVAKAEADLADRNVTAVQQRLAPLGAEITMQLEPFQAATISVLDVRLGENWHGTNDDLRQIALLKPVRHFRLRGQPIGDEVVKMFADKEALSYLQLFDTKVTTEAVDAVKAKHPDAIVYVRNQALLGVAAENNAAGVVVIQVPPDTAAAKVGIVQGDIIAAIDGKPLPDFDRLTARIGQHQPGDKVEVEIIRNNQRIKLNPVLGTRIDQD
jgi:serine protease Do